MISKTPVNYIYTFCIFAILLQSFSTISARTRFNNGKTKIFTTINGVTTLEERDLGLPESGGSFPPVSEVDVNLTNYTEARATQYLMYSYAAYCGPENLANWTCFWCVAPEIVNQNMEVTHIFINNDTDTFGYAGVNNEEILFSFRGTDPHKFEDWVTDLEFAKAVPFRNDQIPGALVHEGFLAAWRGVHKHVMQSAIELKKTFPFFSFTVTGHSLGGALSVIAATDLLLELDYAPIRVWTFGQPRVGNDVFAQYFSEVFPISWRSVNERDLVPHLPPVFLGFHNIATEVWYANSTHQYVICNGSGEDPLCSDSLFFYDLSDHFLYLGINERSGDIHNC